MVEERRIRVLVVDDEPSVRHGLGEVLATDRRLLVVGGAGSVNTAVQQARTLNPDVVVMDLRLPDGSGIEASRAIRTERKHTRVVVNTAYSPEEAMVASLLADASNYVAKDLNVTRLVDAIVTAEDGARLGPSELQRIVRQLLRVAKRLEGRGEMSRSVRDGESVVLLIGEGFADDEIARRLDVSPLGVRQYAAILFDAFASRR